MIQYDSSVQKFKIKPLCICAIKIYLYIICDCVPVSITAWLIVCLFFSKLLIWFNCTWFLVVFMVNNSTYVLCTTMYNMVLVTTIEGGGGLSSEPHCLLYTCHVARLHAQVFVYLGKKKIVFPISRPTRPFFADQLRFFIVRLKKVFLFWGSHRQKKWSKSDHFERNYEVLKTKNF